jgi:aryl-alcohol dehydrogenase-like predicted oxidoreductase
VSDLRARFPRFSREALTANRPVVDPLQRIGARYGATPAQVALAWLLMKHSWIVPIPGTTQLQHLHENLGALDVPLSPRDMQEIEDGFADLRVHGGRTDEQLAAGIDDGALLGTSSAGGHGRSPLPR